MNSNMIDVSKPFPKYSLIDCDISDDIKTANHVIGHIQKNSEQSGECYLSFYPVAKNIRYVSSYFFKAIKSNKKPVLSYSSRPGEDTFWWSQTKESWFPWLWTRHLENNNTTQDSWCNYFLPIEDLIESDDKSTAELEDFYLYLACLSHVFRISQVAKSSLFTKYVDFDSSQDMIGLQIRRGELVPNSGSVKESWSEKNASNFGGRPIYEIDDYMIGVSMISEATGIKNVYVSTDSAETIDYLKTNYTDYTFYYAKFDRDKFIRYNGDPSKVALEFDVFRNQHLIELYTESCLIDLYMLSECNAFVGGMVWSEYGITGWLSQIAKKRKITPYYNVEGEFDTNGQQTKLLLL